MSYQKCSGGKEIDKMNCETCKNNYFKLIDNLTECYEEDKSPDNYFFDQNNTIHKRCYLSCKKCSEYMVHY